ncbi:flowering time control protein FCA isoform X1 [Quercus suber]|uniref:flowering time control protein FCA isoform X1 n=1 Tax=Quercus suber TaxID=58331 RepID=UPI0032DFE337
MERQRGDRFNGQQESQHQNQQLSDHHSHHEQQQQHHFNNSNYQVQDQQHLNNPNYHSNYHHHDQHFNNSNYQQHPPHHHNHHQHVNFEPNDSSSFGSGGFPPNSGAGGYGSGSGYSVRKRGRHRGDTPDNVDGFGNVKLYVVPVSRTATEGDIRPVFEEHGNVVEVVILKDKRTGQQQGSCFVKYATVDEAERAIRSLNNQYTFPGEHAPLTVKYADRERERLGVVDKLYVGCLNKDASKMEVEEIFSAYGLIEDVYIVRDELKQSRGCGFVKFSHWEMALAAIKALNGTFKMRGCDQPLIVRFADPKKPKIGEPRGNHIFANTNFAPCSQEPFARNMVAPGLGNSMGGCILPNASYPLRANSTSSLPQSVSQMEKQEPFVQQSFPPLQQLPSQLAQMPLQQTRTPQTSSQSSQLEGSEVQRQSHQTEKVEQQLSSQVNSQQSPTVASSSTSPAVPLSPHTTASLECDWSEHTCPDGHKYYYNCVTRESRWMKPQEYALHEQQLVKHQNLQNPSQQLQSSLPVLSSQQVIQIEQELDHVQLQSESSPVIGPTCA